MTRSTNIIKSRSYLDLLISSPLPSNISLFHFLHSSLSLPLSLIHRFSSYHSMTILDPCFLRQTRMFNLYSISLLASFRFPCNIPVSLIALELTPEPFLKWRQNDDKLLLRYSYFCIYIYLRKSLMAWSYNDVRTFDRHMTETSRSYSQVDTSEKPQSSAISNIYLHPSYLVMFLDKD